MQSSAYYKAKIDEYKGYQGQVNSVLGSFDGIDSVKTTCSDLENVIINGKRIDNDKLDECISNLEGARSGLKAIIGECDEKIAENQILYEAALKYEEELRRMQEEARRLARENSMTREVK